MTKKLSPERLEEIREIVIMTDKNTLKDLITRAAKHDPNSILVFAGYEFQQGVAWADRQWIKVILDHFFKYRELGIEDVAEITGFTVDELEDIMDVDNLMGAPIW